MLYVCGSNGCGQLGLSHTDDVDQWTLVDTDLRGEVDIRGGGNHTVIVEKDSGRALISLNSRFLSIIHPHQRKWRLASAGWDFTYLVDDQNQIWWSDPTGQVNCRPWVFPAPINEIRSGMKHTAVLLTNGQIFAWGGSRKGQCGVAASQVYEPTRIVTEDEWGLPVSVACGRDYTVVLSLKGDQSRLTIYGDQQKFPDLTSVVFPASLATVQSGWSHILVNGQVFGKNSLQQCEVPCERYTSATLGSEHGLLVADQVVHTWGWGEHGNCPPPHKFGGTIRVFAGCATSFVYIE